MEKLGKDDFLMKKIFGTAGVFVCALLLFCVPAFSAIDEDPGLSDSLMDPVPSSSASAEPAKESKTDPAAILQDEKTRQVNAERQKVALAAAKTAAAAGPLAGKFIEPGDKLMIKIYPEDAYVHGGEMDVTPEGNVTLPLVGKFKVGGKTINQASEDLREIIDRDYLVNPEVVIQVMGFKEQSFVVLGQVRKPGTYQFPPDDKKFTFLQAISMAGGFSEVANIKKVRIVRQEDGQRKIMRLNAEQIISGDEEDPQLTSGDVINVSESLF